MLFPHKLIKNQKPLTAPTRIKKQSTVSEAHSYSTGHKIDENV